MFSIKIVSNSNFFKPIANPIQLMKMADAFSGIGFNVEIFLPGWKKSIDSLELKERFGVKNNFKINFIPKISVKGKFSTFSFALGSYLKSLNWNDRAIIITRNERAATLFVRKGKKTIYENHTFSFSSENISKKYRQRVKALMKSENVCMITISERLKDLWIDYGINPDKIFAAHDGVDLEEFKRTANFNKKELREKLGLPDKKKLVCYVGSLYKDRGIEFIVDAADFFKEKEYLFLIIGGNQSDIYKYKKKFKHNNVIFTGYVENSRVPFYLRCVDLLVMPYQSTVVTIDGCSPMKVFEYLASGTCILAPIFTSIHEVMNDFDGITFYEAHDKNRFISEIDRILLDSNVMRFHDRFDKLNKYSWKNRAKKLLNIYSQFFQTEIPPIFH